VIRNCGRKGRNTNASVGRYEEVRVDAATPDIDADRLQSGKVCGDIEGHPLSLTSISKASQSSAIEIRLRGPVLVIDGQNPQRGGSSPSKGPQQKFGRLQPPHRKPIQHAPAADECHFLKHIVKTVFGYQGDALTFRDVTPGNAEAGKISVWSYKM
jgi:hypothetical protein